MKTHFTISWFSSAFTVFRLRIYLSSHLYSLPSGCRIPTLQQLYSYFSKLSLKYFYYIVITSLQLRSEAMLVINQSLHILKNISSAVF
nr:MAG TPA: hypothetical protein [Caudoviricetes sp.]